MTTAQNTSNDHVAGGDSPEEWVEAFRLVADIPSLTDDELDAGAHLLALICDVVSSCQLMWLLERFSVAHVQRTVARQLVGAT